MFGLIRTKTAKAQTNATLTILISQILDRMETDENYGIQDILDQWIEGNDLHPEKVVTIPKDELPENFTVKDIIKIVEEMRKK